MRAALILLASLAFGETQGLAPRRNATGYPARAAVGSFEIAAEVLDSEQVRRAFASALYKEYVVVEVAVYPAPGESVELSSLDFALRLRGVTSAVRPASARTVAGVLNRKSGRSPVPSGTVVYTTAEIGYGSGAGNDPGYGGQRRGGWRGGGGVAVGTPGMGSPYPAPSSRRDPVDAEIELSEQALPEGLTNRPVAGYLYFPLPGKAKAADAIGLDYHSSSGQAEITFPKPTKRP